METLKELRDKYNNLNKERTALYNKIIKLKQQEVTNNFIVGECYLNVYCESFKKIIAMDKNVLHCIVVNNKNIQRDFYYLHDTIYWEKITSDQFKDVYLAVMKDIQDPDLENKKASNWDVALKSVVESINKEK